MTAKNQSAGQLVSCPEETARTLQRTVIARQDTEELWRACDDGNKERERERELGKMKTGRKGWKSCGSNSRQSNGAEHECSVKGLVKGCDALCECDCECECVKSIKRTFHVTDPCGTWCGKWTRATCGQDEPDNDVDVLCLFCSAVFNFFFFAAAVFIILKNWNSCDPFRSPTPRWLQCQQQQQLQQQWQRHCVQLQEPVPLINSILCSLSHAACQRSWQRPAEPSRAGHVACGMRHVLHTQIPVAVPSK